MYIVKIICKKTSLIFLTLIIAMLVCIGCGGGGIEAKKCVNVKVDKISLIGDIGVDVLGTVTNNCSKKIRYAKIETTCFSSSGSVVDRDPEYVENVSPGGKAYYQSPMNATPVQVDRCTSEVTEADY